MKNLYTLLIFLLVLCFSTQSKAQDPRFTQFYMTPHMVNPALTGVFQGQFRVIANYRELYTSILANNPYRTMSASFDFKQPVMRGDYVGFGFSALKDEAGSSRFNRQQAHLNASFLKQLNGGTYTVADQYLVAGAQLGIGQHGFDWTKIWFTNQFNDEFAYVDPSQSSGENFSTMNTDTYLDFSAGLLWYALFDDNQSIYFGGAFHHLNTPNVSLLGDETEDLYMRWVGQIGGELPFDENLSLLPALVIMGQNQSLSATGGFNFRYTNRDWKEVAIRAGVWGHLSNNLDQGMAMDAMSVAAILETGRMQFGIGYDITTSKLSTANNSRGAFEVNIIYIQPPKGRRVRVNCPKF